MARSLRLGLVRRRKAAGFTQEAMAEALGVTRAALAAWETGRGLPSAGLLPDIAALLLCSIDDLYEETPETGCNVSGEIIELPFPKEGN